ncbi:hypothetical protein PCH_Pc13g14620 [Penicillium rubens Wisconsin 54-1255]|uniref:Uncharacterized protein n=1 Tax=Penicillium rubens (strain ATCC 28089 / DSM 1075 / NRRL 1951 / Wisconsin 54-1255) TaxID=500485 RepID=B6H2I4_PENRW|nr:hypothetical protein PCH_Pc13g14620 [Penicillium rubens Wisconsin 54-1255]
MYPIAQIVQSCYRDTSSPWANRLDRFATMQMGRSPKTGSHHPTVPWRHPCAHSKICLLPMIPQHGGWMARFLRTPISGMAISVPKYGVVYLAARWECREEFLSTFTVDYQTRLIPPTAISAIGVGHIAVRAEDFKEDSVRMLDNRSAIWDLHDFAHLSAASVCPDLYGSKYFTHLIKLPSELTALIRSSKMHTADPTPRYSDGVLFSKLLTVLFTSEIEAVQRAERVHTYLSLTDTLAEYVADYLMGRLQNKAYELTASEIEQRVFTRGCPAGDSRDELDRLSAFERVKLLAGCRRWLYLEMRKFTMQMNLPVQAAIDWKCGSGPRS